MPIPGRIFAGDEEQGKKNDDHRPVNGTIPMPGWSWTRWKATPRVRRRRTIIAMALGLFLYFFIRNIPTDLGPISQKLDARIPGKTFTGIPLGVEVVPQSPSGQPPHGEDQLPSEKPYYNGQIMFYKLGASLHGIAQTMGYRENNKNVLFAAAGLQSASRLIPVACEMSRWNRNVVHFAFMGREELSLDDIRIVNGVGADCNVFWHDARPDYSIWSTELRMGRSVEAALSHIHKFMHPQVYLVDGGGIEEWFFLKAIRRKGHDTRKSVIELPAHAVQRLLWVTRLDHESLQAWNNIYVDILIQAPLASSGSLLRLLHSIEEAEYSGFRRPHLTIELPPDIDPPTQSFIENLVWPPLEPAGAPHASQVTLRHRISRQRLGTEEASLHFVESFYPARPDHSHVLILSPQVEVSKLYFHYLMYNILEYRHSTYGPDSYSTDKLVGISLDLPSQYLNDSESFHPPLLKAVESPAVGPPEESSPSLFLWEAPNSNAALYFGDKWAEFHSFLTSRLTAQAQNFVTRPKQISHNYPSWTEYLLELMRARGYYVLYPNLPSSPSLATIHNELYQLPEESSPPPPRPDLDSPPADTKEPFLAGPSPASNQHPLNPELPLVLAPLLTILPDEGDLPQLISLPSLSYSGELLTPFTARQRKEEFAREFKREVGGCNSNSNKLIYLMKADDLFCLDEDEANVEEGSPSSLVGSIKLASGTIFPPVGKPEAVAETPTSRGSGDNKAKEE